MRLFFFFVWPKHTTNTFYQQMADWKIVTIISCLCRYFLNLRKGTCRKTEFPCRLIWWIQDMIWIKIWFGVTQRQWQNPTLHTQSVPQSDKKLPHTYELNKHIPTHTHFCTCHFGSSSWDFLIISNISYPLNPGNTIKLEQQRSHLFLYTHLFLLSTQYNAISATRTHTS